MEHIPEKRQSIKKTRAGIPCNRLNIVFLLVCVTFTVCECHASLQCTLEVVNKLKIRRGYRCHAEMHEGSIERLQPCMQLPIFLVSLDYIIFRCLKLICSCRVKLS